MSTTTPHNPATTGKPQTPQNPNPKTQDGTSTHQDPPAAGTTGAVKHGVTDTDKENEKHMAAEKESPRSPQ